MRLLKRILLGLVLILAVLATAAYIYLQTLKPKLSGEVSIPGLGSPVEVFYDKHGVPHIYAASEEDAYMVFGWVHAQDRLFQMEMLRRAASGRLAEVLGSDLVEVDKLFRTLGLNHFSKEQATRFLGADTAGYQRAAHAYLRGVNAFVEHGKTPLEFSIIGIPKSEFSPEDIYSVIGFMALGFAEGFEVDPVFQLIRTQYGEAYLADLAVKTPADAVIIPVVSNPVKPATNKALISALHNAFAKLPVPLLQGSNGWVVSAERSSSGYPILCNDTHIGFSQPAVWYEAHIEYPGFSFYGHHLAGLPFGILGNNRFCGWGLTMFENDDVDFFVEKVNPSNPDEVMFKGSWERLDVRHEVIKVKDGDDILFPVRKSRHGPIVNGIVDHVGGDQPIALSWLLLQQDNHALEAAYRLGRAATFDEAESAVSLFSSPGLNVMYGDVDGNIAWWAAARLPVRPPHVQSKLFLDGAGGADEYAGYYEFKNNPKSVNPTSGFVYSANNQPDSVNGVLYPGYYYPRSRAGRIVQMLSGDRKFSALDMRGLMLDNKSSMHADVARLISGMATELRGNETYRVMVDALDGWDGAHDTDASGPVVYYNVLSQILFLTMEDELGSEALATLLKTAVLKNSLTMLLSNEASPWFDDISTPDIRETRGDIIAKAFGNAHKTIVETCGEKTENWKWGRIHTLTHKHALGSVKPLDRFFNVGPFQAAGGSEVINNLDFRYNLSGQFPSGSGPALRKITDFREITNGLTVSPTGQSGNLMSSFYDDQAEMFVKGEFRSMLMERAQVEQNSRAPLNFIPAVK